MTAMNGGNTSRSVSRRVIEAVADKRGTDPAELEPLYRSIDPDYLEKLFSDRSRTDASAAQTCTRLVFTYEEHRIRVSRDGSIDVDPIEGTERHPERIRSVSDHRTENK